MYCSGHLLLVLACFYIVCISYNYYKYSFLVASVMLKLGNPTTGSLTMMIPIGALTTGFATAEMTTFSWTWETFSSSSACLGIPALGAGGAVQGGSGGEDKCLIFLLM